MSALREILLSFGSEFDPKGLKQGESAVVGLGEKLKKFAAAAATAFAVKEVWGFTLGIAEQATELKHHAEALGISAQSLQQWDFAASLSGVSADELQIGLQKLQRSAVGAGGKGGELGAVFDKLQVKVKNSNGSFKNADELLTDVAGAIGDMKDPTLQTATAMQIFGRGGARLLPFLKQGRAGVAALKAEVAELGGGFTDDFIEKSEQMVQDSKRLEFAFTSFKVKALGPLIPILTNMAQGATKWAVKAGDMIGKSNAAKAALIALGVGGAVALAPLLLSIAPLIAGFFLLEDALTFFSGGKSVTGDLLDKVFGKGAADKVRGLVNALANEVGPTIKAIFAIFTDGESLDTKFRELNAYVSNVLGPQWKEKFGAMGEDMAMIIEAAASLAETLKDIIDAMKWVASHTVGAIGSAIFSASDATANDAARNDAVARNNPGRAPSAADFNLEQQPWYSRAAAWVSGFDPNDAVPQLNPAHAAPQQASAPVGAAAYTAEVQQTNNTPITQNFYGIDKAEDAGRAASEGAKSGVATGTKDRTKRALVPTAG